MVLPNIELMDCPKLAVPTDVMHHVVNVESSFNPYAIGVVGGRLVRQPGNLPEALSTVRMLASRGFNFSLGLAQVNRYNLDKYGLDSYEKAFQACPNLQAGSRILADCYRRSGNDWGKSFSCYYSGNFVTGYRYGYVQKIFASMRKSEDAGVASASWVPIEVLGTPSRHTLAASRHDGQVSRQQVVRRIEASSTVATAAQVPVAAKVPSPAAQQQVGIVVFEQSGKTPDSLQTNASGDSADAAFVF